MLYFKLQFCLREYKQHYKLYLISFDGAALLIGDICTTSKTYIYM